jgi:hypothetical protein
LGNSGDEARQNGLFSRDKSPLQSGQHLSAG